MTGRLGALLQYDLRSLAAARISLGAWIVIDCVQRALDFDVLLGADGILPLPSVQAGLERFHWWTIYAWNGSDAWAAALLALTFVAGLLLTLGFRTRWVAPLAWILLVSLQNRTYLLDYPGDTLARLLLLWGCFLPWGEHWSLDARRHATAPPLTGSSPAMLPLLVQMFLFFFVAALSKTGREWWDGSAVSATMQLKFFGTDAGRWLASVPGLGGLLTLPSLVAEIALPLLLLSPWKTVPLRRIACIGLGTLSLVFGIFVNFNLLGLASVAGLLALLPGGTVTPRSAVPRRLDLAAAVAGSLLLVYANWGPLRQFGYRLPDLANAPADRIVAALRLDQLWMFFPAPREWPDGWVVIAGRDADGRETDLLRATPLRWEEPETMVGVLPSFRQLRGISNSIWGAYMNAGPEWHYSFDLLGRHYCRLWAARQPQKEVETWIEVVFSRYETPVRREKRRLGLTACGSDP